MAVATPVLERSSAQELEDRKHNALINLRYAKLINPDSKMPDLKSDTVREEYGEEAAVNAVAETAAAEEVCEPVAETHTYAAQSSAATGGFEVAEISRADSAINRRLRAQSAAAVQSPVVSSDSEEEDNEDLRPTPTTIQYKTAEKMKADVEEGGKISTDSKKHINLSKREIIIIAAVVTVIVSLFVLIIVNSAIISGINSDIGELQSSLNTVRGAYSSVQDQISDYMTNHLEEDVRKLAESLGMVK